MAHKIPSACVVKVFRIIADASLKEMQDYAERFFERTGQ